MTDAETQVPRLALRPAELWGVTRFTAANLPPYMIVTAFLIALSLTLLVQVRPETVLLPVIPT